MYEKNNYSYLRWLSGCRYFDVLLPFYVIYGRYVGLTYKQIFATQSIFAIFLVLLTLPGGIFSDLFGRKKSILIGSLCLMISALCFWLLRTFSGFVAAEIFMAMAYSFFSSSESALLYESAKSCGQLDMYLAQESNVHAYARFGEALSSFLGGILATFHVMLLPIVKLAISIPVFILSTSLVETKLANFKFYRTDKTIKQILILRLYKKWLLIKRFLFTTDKAHIRIIIIYSAFISNVTLSAFWLLQVFVEQHSLSYFFIGFIWLTYHFGAGISSHYAAKLITKYQAKLIVYLPIFLLIILLILSFTDSRWNFLWILGSAFAYGIKMPLANYLLNLNLPGASRVSVMSVDAFLTRFIFSILAVILGYTLDYTSLNNAFIVVLFPNFCAIALSIYLWRKRHFYFQVT